MVAPSVIAPLGSSANEQINTVIDGAITVSDADSPTLASASVTVTGNYQAGEDVLAFANAGTTIYGNIVANFNSSTGALNLTSSGATATVVQWQAALRAVTYTDTSDAPNTSDRSISFQVNDGAASSNLPINTVTVTAIDDAPSFAAGTGKVATPIGSLNDYGQSA